MGRCRGKRGVRGQGQQVKPTSHVHESHYIAPQFVKMVAQLLSTGGNDVGGARGKEDHSGNGTEGLRGAAGGDCLRTEGGGRAKEAGKYCT